MDDRPLIPKYRKHDDLDRQHEIILNSLGFVPHESLDWPTLGGSYVVRLIGKVSEHMACNHPGNPELYSRLVPELSRLSRKLPERVIQSHVYDFMQAMTSEALKLVQRLQQIEPYIEPSEPVRSAKVHRPQHRRAKRQQSVAVDSLQRRIDGEHRREINDVLAGG